MNIAFISAVLPVAILLYITYRQDKQNPEPIKLLLLTFFVGCLSVIPAAIMELFLDSFQPTNFPILAGIYEGYIVAGTSEELCKLILLMLVIWRNKHFDEYMDGIVYAVFISMGFACVENIQYVIGSEDPLSIALLRGILAVPAHFLFAVTMGYHLALAKFDLANRRTHIFHAFLYPMLLHGTYDSLLMVSDKLNTDNNITNFIATILIIVFIVFDIKMWRWGIRRIRRMQERTHDQNFDRLHPFDGFTWNV